MSSESLKKEKGCSKFFLDETDNPRIYDSRGEGHMSMKSCSKASNYIYIFYEEFNKN